MADVSPLTESPTVTVSSMAVPAITTLPTCSSDSRVVSCAVEEAVSVMANTSASAIMPAQANYYNETPQRFYRNPLIVRKTSFRRGWLCRLCRPHHAPPGPSTWGHAPITLQSWQDL